MPDTSQLPHLLKLIDDESSAIRESILTELNAYGTSLEEEIFSANVTLNEAQKRILEPILAVQRRSWLKEVWSTWMSIDAEFQKLEAALTYISQFQSGTHYPTKLSDALDDLADHYKVKYPDADSLTLGTFLFQQKRLR